MELEVNGRYLVKIGAGSNFLLEWFIIEESNTAVKIKQPNGNLEWIDKNVIRNKYTIVEKLNVLNTNKQLLKD